MPNAIDIFSIETRSRRVIGELINPIMTEIDEDRQKVAQLGVDQTKIYKRIQELEYSVGLIDSKPKIFQDIDDSFA